MDKIKRCRINLKPDNILGYKLELSGNCDTELGIIENLPDRKRSYLKRRLDIQSESSSSSNSSS